MPSDLSPMLGTARVEIPASRNFITPALEFLASCSRQFPIEVETQAELRSAVEKALGLMVDRNSAETLPAHAGSAPLSLEVGGRNGRLSVALINRGVPIHSDSARSLPRLAGQWKGLESLSLENLGRGGQRVTFEVKLQTPVLPFPSDGAPLEALHPSEIIEIRPLREGEEAALSELFYLVYGYQYINEFVYFPEKIRAMRQDGRLISVVAADASGKILGHVGLLRWNDAPHVYEPCLGVVDPRQKSRGIFSRVFSEIMRQVREMKMQYCFVDFVTNHDFSQRMVTPYGSCETALLVGCQSKITQAKLEKLGLGPDPTDMDRYSLLYGVIPCAPHPFGREIALPQNIGEQVGFLLAPLNLAWSPAPRFQRLPSGGHFRMQTQPAQGAVHFDLDEPGRGAVEEILAQWQQLLRDGFQYASIEVPVELFLESGPEVPALGHLYDLFAEHGFFLAGFMPYHHSARLALRLQALAPAKVAFDKIRMHTETAKKLLIAVQADYERNRLL